MPGFVIPDGVLRLLRGVAFAGAFTLALPQRVHADPNPADRAAAEALFRDAKRLMEKKEWPTACRKLEESQRLDAQGGTLLNLAVCHAREGRTASAWVEFQEAVAAARESKRQDRIRLAERELKALEKNLSRLSIEVPEDARVPGLTIERAGESVGQGAWGTPVPIDPDMEIELVASADGYRSYRTRVAAKVGEQKTIVVPKLEKLPPQRVAAKPGPTVQRREPEDKSTERTIAYVVGGAGVVAIGIGSYFGLRAISKNSDGEKHCNGKLCDAEGVELNEDADRAATISNVAFGIGIVAIGVGTYFFINSLSDGKSAPAGSDTALRLTPAIGPKSGGLSLERRF